jgi:hypothetical protein
MAATGGQARRRRACPVFVAQNALALCAKASEAKRDGAFGAESARVG